MSTDVSLDSAAPTPHPRRRFRINRNFGTGAGFLALAVGLSAALGAVWGWWRPAYEGTIEDGDLLLEGGTSVEFTSFITFVVITGLLGVVLSMLAYLRSPDTRGFLMLCWLGLVALVAAVMFWLVGEQVALMLHDPAAAHRALNGERISIVPPLSPGIGFVAAPLMAMMSYWLSVIIDPVRADGD